MQDIASIGFSVDTRQLEKGQQELNKMATAGEKTEKSMDGVTSSANKTAKATSDLTKNTTQVSNSFSGLGRNAGQASIQIQQFVGQVQAGQSPMLALSQQAADLGIVLGAPLIGSIVGVGAALAGPLIASLIDTTEETETLADRVANLTKELDGFGDEVQGIQMFDLIDQIFTSGEAIDEASGKLTTLRDRLQEIADQDVVISEEGYRKLTEEIRLQEQEVDLLSARYDRANEALTRLDQVTEKSTQTSRRRTTEFDRQKAAAERYIETLQRQIDTFGKTQAETIRYTAEQRALEAATADLSFEILAAGNAYANLVEQQDEAEASAKMLEKAQREASQEAERAAREYERAFESLSDNITDAIIDFENLGNTVENVFRSIDRSIVQSGVNDLLSSFGVPGAPSVGGSLLGSAGSSVVNTIGQATGITDLFTPSSFVGPTRLTDVLAGGSGSAIPGFLTGVAAPAMFITAGLKILSSLFSGSKPRMTFAQGEDVTKDIVMGGFGREGDDTITSTYGYRESIETLFGEFGVLEGPFTKKVEQEQIDAYLGLVESVDASIASLLDESTIKNIATSLAERQTFLGEYEVYLGEGEYETRQRTSGTLGSSTGDPTYQLIERYTQIINEALPEAFSDQLLAETEDLEQFANNAVMSLDMLKTSQSIFIDDLDELAYAYTSLSQEGESFSQFFSRVNQAAIADLQEFAIAIQNTFAGIESLAGLSLSIREQLLTDEQLYDRLREQADAIGDSISTLADPEAIQQAIAEYQQLTGRAFGLLSDEQQQLFGAEIADSIDTVVAAATERVGSLIEEKDNSRSIEDFATSTQEMANTTANFGTFVEQFGSFVQQATQASQAMLAASATLRQAAQEANAQTNNVWTGRL